MINANQLENDTRTQDKLRGGYYTSPLIAKLLCNWAIRSSSDFILEPSCGDGVFIEAAINKLSELGARDNQVLNQLVGVEILSTEAEKSHDRFKGFIDNYSQNSIYTDDFFPWIINNFDKQFNCVVGNPPFIRYQNFPEPSRSVAMSLLKKLDFRPNKLTNIWVPFVAASTIALAPGGRLAMVLPAELLQVSYASQLRSFLVNRFNRIDILTCNDLLFERAEQEVVLFLADGYREKPDSEQCHINLIEVPRMEDLVLKMSSIDIDDEIKLVNHESEKWLKYFLTSTEISFMRELRNSPEIVNLSHHATIDVGIVTGKNDFFVVSNNEIETYLLKDYVVPLVGRSSQLKGAILKKSEWKQFADNGQKVFLFSINDNSNGSLSKEVKEYISFGEHNNFHTGYKCSIRSPWYKVPSVWIPDCFLFRQIYDFPRVILNTASAVSTDTIHRMRCKSNRKKIISSMYTHLTAACAEIEGRSYGGGVLELEPTEAERLLIPKNLVEGVSIQEIDELIRMGRIEHLLEENDKKVLIDSIGFSERDSNMLKGIWMKMRNRRMSRSRRKKQ